jgi:hypothetical protein
MPPGYAHLNKYLLLINTCAAQVVPGMCPGTL